MADQMKPHPRGLPGRVADALDDLALLRADPNADPQALAWAKTKSDALCAALSAAGDDPNISFGDDDPNVSRSSN